MRRALLLVFGLLAAACDTTSDLPPAPLSLASPFDDVALEEESAATQLPLAGRFSGVDSEAVIRASASTAAVRAEVVGEAVVLTPLAPGTATVTVTVSRPGAASVSDAFEVTVAGRCPRTPADRVALFREPFGVGQAWTFALSTSSVSPATSPRRSTGRVVLTVTAVGGCTGGTQQVSVRESTTEQVEAQNPFTGEWTPVGGPQTRQITYAWTLSDADVTTSAPDLGGREGGGNLAPPPFGRTAPRHAAEAPGGTVRLGEGQPFGPHVTLGVGEGPVSFRSQTSFGTAGEASVSWTLLPG